MASDLSALVVASEAGAELNAGALHRYLAEAVWFPTALLPQSDKQVPWEGHFRDYQVRADMRVPMYDEVGWYVDETLQIVWKGNLIDVRYELGP